MNKLRRRQFGMTLIELLVVMGLLAALATYALTSLDGLSDRSRVDTTINRLNILQQAIAGDGLTASRFMNDMGRLPYVTTAQDGHEFIELFKDAKNIGVVENYSYTPEIDGKEFSLITVKPNYGWKGPYIVLTSDEFYDGFGEAFEIKTQDNTTWHNPGGSESGITDVRSLGRDGESGSGQDWADEDMEINDLASHSQATLTIRIRTTYRGSSTTEPVWAAPLIKAVKSSVTAIGSYAEGDIFLNSSGQLFRCKSNVTFTTAAASPAWNTTSAGEETSITDGTVTALWEYMGKSSQYMTEVKAVIFCPDTTGSSAGVDEKHGQLSSAGDTITITGLSPGVRWLFVYGGLVASSGSSVTANCYSSALQSIELKPGDNSITVYLATAL